MTDGVSDYNFWDPKYGTELHMKFISSETLQGLEVDRWQTMIKTLPSNLKTLRATQEIMTLSQKAPSPPGWSP
jgi:hypothetical protein